jgi:hypothetical protein
MIKQVRKQGVKESTGVRTEHLAQIRYKAAIKARDQKLNILLQERDMMMNKLYASASDRGGYHSQGGDHNSARFN